MRRERVDQLALGRRGRHHLVVGRVVTAQLHVSGGVAGREVVVGVVSLGGPRHAHWGMRLPVV